MEGFAPELAIVTMGGGKELEEPLVRRSGSASREQRADARCRRSCDPRAKRL